MGILNILVKNVVGKKKQNQQSNLEKVPEHLPRKFKNRKSEYFLPKSGWRKDLEKPVRSKMEANVWRYYKFIQHRHGKIKVEYEPEVFQLYDFDTGSTLWYIPDFKISSNSAPYYVEVKGIMDARAVKKARNFRKNYSGLKLYFVTPKEYLLIQKSYSKYIRNWE